MNVFILGEFPYLGEMTLSFDLGTDSEQHTKSLTAFRNDHIKCYKQKVEKKLPLKCPQLLLNRSETEHRIFK